MKLFNAPLKIENLIIKQNPSVGMTAIIAIHSLKRGPALGGCRFVSYDSVDAAMMDAMKLAEAMTYKSAMADLPLGGGKSVIINHANIRDRAVLFRYFGEMVDSLNGQYITATDSGTTEEDMKIVANKTKHVTSISKTKTAQDDTASMTANGVLRAIQAAVKHKFKRDDLEGIHVAIQGVGSVGYLLSKLLIAQGAKLTIGDKNQQALARCQAEFAANVVNADHITSVACDVFAPCALGGVIHSDMIGYLNTPIVCGAANNQLRHAEDGELLRQKGILYLPDYVVNAGGLICAAAQSAIISMQDSIDKVNAIYDSALEILNAAQHLQLATNVVANQLAEARFV